MQCHNNTSSLFGIEYPINQKVAKSIYKTKTIAILNLFHAVFAREQSNGGMGDCQGGDTELIHLGQARGSYHRRSQKID